MHTNDIEAWVRNDGNDLECCDLSQLFPLGRLGVQAAPRSAVRRGGDDLRFAGRKSKRRTGALGG
jgi:hypothetical protein